MFELYVCVYLYSSEAVWKWLWFSVFTCFFLFVFIVNAILPKQN